MQMMIKPAHAPTPLALNPLSPPAANPNNLPTSPSLTPPIQSSPPPSPTKPLIPAFNIAAAPHAPSHSPSMGAALAPLLPTDDHLPAAASADPTPPPSRPFPQLPLPLSSSAPPTSTSNHHPSSSQSCTKPMSCVITETGHICQYIRSHVSFYALREGAGSCVDMKISMNADDEHRYEQNHEEQRAITQVQALNGNHIKYANNNHHHEISAEDDQCVSDPELMYGLRQNPKRSRRFADQDTASSEENANMAMRGNDVDDHDASLIAAETRPANVSYKRSMFTKLQEKTPAACTECGREFSSWKALFGHMRCHPEREWRGIQPPAEYSSMRALSKGKSNSNGNSKRYIVVKPLQTAIKQCPQRRTEHMKHYKPCKSPPDDAAMAIKLASEGDNSRLDCFDDNHELQWSACRTQVMLEEEDESETESLEATYMSSKVDEQDSKPLQLAASLPRGKRSKRSHFTIKSLRSVQDQLAAHEVSQDDKSPPSKKEDLEMATCLVMLALAGSDTKIENQEAEGVALSKEEPIDLVDANDDDESSIGNQLRLSTWGRNDMCAATEPRTLEGISNNAGSRDGTILSIGEGEGGKYECTACKRIFKSHQALGGHRASHKKVKGCFAKTAGDATEANSPSCHKEGLSGIVTFLGGASMLSLAGSCSKDQSAATSYAPLSVAEYNRAGNDKDIIPSAPDTKNAVAEGPGYIISSSPAAEGGHLHLLLNGMDVAAHASRSSSKLALHNNSSKYHQCSICQRVFSSGQALGGHKRCHWAADKTAAGNNLAIPEHGGLVSVRPDMMAGSGGRTSVSAMAACVAAPAAKLSFFTRSMTPEEAVTHQVKVLGIDLNLPAPAHDQESADDIVPKPYNNIRAASQLGSLLSLGQCSSVTIHDAPSIPGFADEDVLHRTSDHASAALSVSSSPSSTTSNIPISDSGPC